MTLINKYNFYILSLLFCIAHLITISSSTLPWIDEVMFIDLPVNVFQQGLFQTTAYAAKKGVIPFPTYPPLYSFFIFIWIKLFNFSLFTIRSFNVLLILLFSFLGLVVLEKNKMPWMTKLFFLLLIWFSNTFIWIFKNGRVDTLNLVLCSMYIYSTYESGFKKWIKTCLIILIVISGVQASLYILLYLIWIFLSKLKDYDRCLDEFKNFLVGTIIGFLIMLAFFYVNNQTIPFLSFLLSSASGVKKFTLSLLKFLNINGYDYNFIHQSSRSFDMLHSLKQNREFLILFIIICVIISYQLIRKRISLSSIELKILVFILFVTFIFSLSGHFIIYYTWMIYIPAILLFILLSQKLNNLSFMIPLIFFLSFNGINEQIISSKKSIQVANIDIFLKKNINISNSVVLAPFNSYYTIKKISNEVYFPGIYPSELIPKKIDYLIYSKEEFGSGKTLAILQNYLAESKAIKIDSINNPDLILYKILK